MITMETDGAYTATPRVVGRSTEERIMLRALQLIDDGHDWHSYDWHLLTGPTETRVAALLARRAECDGGLL